MACSAAERVTHSSYRLSRCVQAWHIYGAAGQVLATILVFPLSNTNFGTTFKVTIVMSKGFLIPLCASESACPAWYVLLDTTQSRSWSWF